MVMEQLGDALDTDYIYYDYEGYGCSDEVIDGSVQSIRAVYDYARSQYKGSEIYLAGESSTSVHG